MSSFTAINPSPFHTSNNDDNWTLIVETALFYEAAMPETRKTDLISTVGDYVLPSYSVLSCLCPSVTEIALNVPLGLYLQILKKE